MKTLSIVTSILFLSVGAQASPQTVTGFTAGNNLTATEIFADISVQCNGAGGMEYGYFRCHDMILDPAEYSYFVTEAGGDADSVTLTASWENGKTVAKTEDFDATTGKSTGSFNLWIETLFQRPLLNLGKNQIHFALSKDSQIRREGDFVATITQGQSRRCRNGFVNSFNANDCRTGGFVCDNYFRQENYCQ